jgi:hypothetical protein
MNSNDLLQRVRGTAQILMQTLTTPIAGRGVPVVILDTHAAERIIASCIAGTLQMFMDDPEVVVDPDSMPRLAGQELRKYRWKYNLTLVDVANVVRLPISHVSSIERNARPPLSWVQTADLINKFGPIEVPFNG